MRKPRLLARILLSAMVLTGLNSAAAASSFIPASHPLTDDERLSRSVSGADAICVGRIVAIRDTVIPMSFNPQLGHPYKYGLIRVAQCLRGSFRPGDTIVIGSWDNEFPSIEYNSTQSQGDAIVFLKRVDHSSDALSVNGPDLPSFADWQIDHNPYTVPRGMLRNDAQGNDKVKRRIKNQSIEELSKRSDAAVRVQVFKTPAGESDRYAFESKVIESIFPRSIQRGTTLRINTLLGDELEPGEYILFLRRRGAANYDLLEFTAGAHPMAKGRLLRSGESYSAIRASIANARVAK
jgi:hypothetical protein